MPTTKTNHLGKAGHHAAMAEFLLRGWNVAIPEVDVGGDIFVVNDSADRVIRVQVKTTVGVTKPGRRVDATFSGFSTRQFWSTAEVPFFYVFVRRVDARWDFVVVARRDLQRLREHFESGQIAGRAKRGTKTRPDAGATPSDGKVLTLVLSFTDADVTLWGQSLQAYRNNWQAFPQLSSGPGASATRASRTRAL